MLKKKEENYFNAIKEGNIDELSVLLAENSNLVKAKNEFGMTGIHIGAIHGQIKVVELLLKNGADINTKTKSGFTPVHFAALEGYDNIIELLEKYKFKLNELLPDGRNALHLATSCGHLSTIDLLFFKGVNINHKDNSGRNILHFAESNSHTYDHIMSNYWPYIDINDFIISKEIEIKNGEVSEKINNYLEQSLKEDRSRHWQKVLSESKLESKAELEGKVLNWVQRIEQHTKANVSTQHFHP